MPLSNRTCGCGRYCGSIPACSGKFRADRDMTQEALAEKAGLSRQYVPRLQTGKQDPTLATLTKRAKALNVTVGGWGRKGDHMHTPTFAEIKLVLGISHPESRRNAIQQTYEDFVMARAKFLERATPDRWETLLAVSREIHRDWLKHRQRVPVTHP